jgi:hypothetical protein
MSLTWSVSPDTFLYSTGDVRTASERTAATTAETVLLTFWRRRNRIFEYYSNIGAKYSNGKIKLIVQLLFEAGNRTSMTVLFKLCVFKDWQVLVMKYQVVGMYLHCDQCGISLVGQLTVRAVLCQQPFYWKCLVFICQCDWRLPNLLRMPVRQHWLIVKKLMPLMKSLIRHVYCLIYQVMGRVHQQSSLKLFCRHMEQFIALVIFMKIRIEVLSVPICI